MSKFAQKHSTPGVDLVQLFRRKLTLSTLKAISFHNIEEIMVTLMQWSSLQKSASKLMLKIVLRVDYRILKVLWEQ